MSLPESERLLFRLYTPDDGAAFLSLVTDERVMKFVDQGVFKRDQAKQLWSKLIDEFYPAGYDTIYAVFSKADRKYIGHAAIRPRPEQKQDWEISYMLVTEAWGVGFATEIAGSLIRFGFNELQLIEVFATINPQNVASIAVAHKAGMSLTRTETDDKGETLVFSIKSTP